MYDAVKHSEKVDPSAETLFLGVVGIGQPLHVSGVMVVRDHTVFNVQIFNVDRPDAHVKRPHHSLLDGDIPAVMNVDPGVYGVLAV